jgi:hypothetical protein
MLTAIGNKNMAKHCSKCGKTLQKFLDPTGKLGEFSGKPTFFIRWKCPNKSNGVGHDDFHERYEHTAEKKITTQD